MYKPLPSVLTIKKSPIEGLGLYATENIKANCFIGLTHIKDNNFENGYIRTPLGGFYNHCLLYTSPSPRDRQKSRMPSSA